MGKEGGVVIMEEREAEGEEVKWERYLPRTPVRVLLVEGDDSTRQIIAALLRKCSYRVAAASDGMKAWETLKEKSCSIDLVLTEVDLPFMSGFGLLTMIMEHEICKNIPVIMMSSHDSISMVFKCMLKGAADFLVKPIRKNELRNLWQHVWRRQIASGGSRTPKGNQDLNLSNYELGARLANGNISGENESSMQKNKEFSEQRSDAQSSCTRSDMEAESQHMQNSIERKMLTSLELSIKNPAFVNNSGEQNQVDNSFLMHEPTTEESREVEMVPNENQDHNEIVDKTDQEKSVDLFQDNPKASSVNRSLPHLELSLRRFDYNSLEKQEIDEKNKLNHSVSSPFSLYNYRSRAIPASSDTPDSSVAPIQNLSLNLDETNPASSPVGSGTGGGAPFTPVRAIPVPLPVGGTPFNRLFSGSIPSLVQTLTCESNEARETDRELGERSNQQREEEESNNDDNNNVLSRERHVTGDESTRSSSVSVSNARERHVVGVVNQVNSSCSALSPREMALNKFRLKRKERNFQKTVRYQSRKLLAEKRPRIKGQFVRQDQLVVQPTGEGHVAGGETPSLGF